MKSESFNPAMGISPVRSTMMPHSTVLSFPYRLRSVCTIAVLRALLDDCASAIKSAKSADPAIFNPLRLHCLLKRRGSGVSEWVSDGSPLAPRAIQSRPHEQALLGAGRATLSLRGEMIVPAVGVRLTPIPPLALLHTALYQSLLTRGAEDKPQSG